jgi:hypothetical protein
MDSILKALSVSSLLRSVFAGVFFVISYYVASHSLGKLAEIDARTILAVALPVALFAGVTAYGIHRSLLYPLVEFCFDTRRAKTLRSKIPLISAVTVENLLRRWDQGADQEKGDCERARRITSWADYAHLQYVSALCIALGTLVGVIIVREKHPPSWPLIALAVLLVIAGAVSDWRLRSVIDKM